MKASHRRILAGALIITLSAVLPTYASAWFLTQDETETAPAVAAFAKSTVDTGAVTFSAQDFSVTGDADLYSIVLSQVPDPSVGTLTAAATPLSSGDSVAADALSELEFQFSGPADTDPTAAFSFQPVFSTGEIGEEVSVSLYQLTQENYAPVSENLTFTTYRDIPVAAFLRATDTEGDVLTYQIVDHPARGCVTLAEDGTGAFTYTPYDGKTGKDTFSYTVTDKVGNVSNTATVNLTIQKPAKNIRYADLEDNSAAAAAIRLAEEDIFIGQCIGGTYFFQPEATVTRSEFLAMAMKATGTDSLEGVTLTGFADDDSIPTWAKGYVSAALKSGIISGMKDADGATVFQANAPVTRAECAMMLNELLQISDVSQASAYLSPDAEPAWACQAAANLTSVGIFTAGADGNLALSTAMTRAECAQVLSAALDVQAAKAN